MAHRIDAALTNEIYDELRAIARRRLFREAPGRTLQPTALVNEACLRLLTRDAQWQDRAHFLASVAEVMRSILVDAARRRMTVRHGSGLKRVPLLVAESESGEGADGVDMLALDDALEEFERIDARAADVVRLRFFAGAEIEEIARMQGVSPRTVKRDWSAARLWLYDRIANQR